jgi:fructose-1,6-bisphosphatase/inositol monophosphatase family enzyme
MKNNNNTTMTIEQIGKTLQEELVPRAIKIIQDECADLTIIKKVGYDGVKDDLTTNGDMKAQAMYIKELTTLFPNYGIIAEENGVATKSQDSTDDIYFTVDPLDGTKAYERGSSQGVGTMIALCKNANVIAVCIGDANTGDIYSFAGEDKVGDVFHQRFGVTKKLTPKTNISLLMQYVLLRSMPSKQPALINKMIGEIGNNGIFKGTEICGGSIGIAFARLWKGEIGAMVLEAGFDTPWDLAPIIGISRRLGFKFYDIVGDTLVPHEPVPVKVITERPYNQLVVHESSVKELEEWLTRQ